MSFRTSRHRASPLALAVLALCAGAAQAQPAASSAAAGAAAPASPTLAPIVVNSTRTGRPVGQTPASVSLVEGAAMREGRPGINLTEGLGGVPGLQALNRNNYAQDLQLSIRGFGARSTFGVRGLRIYVDGIPATMPDGQGQTSNIDIASIERVEVLRGPFSALYGNSSGGVIQVFTAPGEGRPRVSASVAGGSDHTFRYGLQASGATGAATGVTDYTASASRFTTRGYRDQSAARKNLANARLGIALADGSQLTLVANAVDLTAQDPLGLSAAQYAADWHSTAPQATQYATRKTVRQTQAGLTYDKPIDGANDLRLMLYYGQRSTVQYQAIPPTAAAQIANGGVIDLDRDYGGADLRWTSRRDLAGRPLTLIGGVAYDQLEEDRKGYNNYLDGAGGRQLGVKGPLKRDEGNDLWNLDPYLQASWRLAERWTLDAGLRYSYVRFKSRDHFLDNGDDSGRASYHRWLPVASLSHQLTPATLLYASAGRGFETPTFNELSYRPDGVAGLNFGLKPATSNNYEIGAKTRAAGGLLTAALFQVDTADEIVGAGSNGGRATFRNLGKTRRHGLELGWGAEFGRDLKAQVAYTLLDATLRSAWRDAGSGKRIPGVARQTLYASLDWTPPQGWRAGADWRYLDRIHANSANSAHAPAYAVTGLYGGYKLAWRQWDWTAIARVDNVFDRKYVGSVIVNEGNSRYYEPAAGRNWLISLSGTYRF